MGELVQVNKFQDDIATEKAIKGQAEKKLNTYAGDFKRFELYCTEQNREISFDSLEKYLYNTIAVEELKLSTFNRRAAGVKYYLTNKYNLVESADQLQRTAKLRSMYNNEEYLRKKNMVGKRAEDKNEVMNIINKLDTRAKAIALVNLITANRPSEMLLLKISDFDFKNKSVIVMMKKQKEMKTKRLTLEAINAVKSYIREYDLKENDLFVGKVDKWNNYTNVAISDTAYRKAIHKWLGFAPYTLRKTQITAMHNAGADIATIAKQSGHKSLETITKHYLEVNDTTVDKYL